ncbi:MAG: hypothetical protein R3362_06655 [Rhodothermales bacterium]|nr:hypothetical protein [Rhodothermales bacterium]
MPPDRPALRRDEPALRPDRQAEAQLRYIRETMARTAEFTAVSGWGGIAMGLTALAAAALAAAQPTVSGWLRVWVAAALIGFAIGAWATARKAQRHGVPLLSGQGRKFLLGLAPALCAGLALTLAVYGFDVEAAGERFARLGVADATASLRLLPGLWLLLYGIGVISAGMFSIRLIPLLGAAFLLVGTLALLSPATWATAWMAVGFGGLHLTFGLLIARRHGG